MKIHTDCRHYSGHKPCRPHKEYGTRCEMCSDHAPIEQRILIVKLEALGDVLRTTSCLRPLKQLYPRSHITWITRTRAMELFTHNPWIDRILTVESNYLEILLAEEFDLALGPDTDPLSSSIMKLARAECKRGFVSDGRGGVIPTNEAAKNWWLIGLDDILKRKNRQTYGAWLYDICELPPPIARPFLQISQDVQQRKTHFLRNWAPQAHRWICLNTGGSGRWQEKRWKKNYYREFAEMLAADCSSTAVVLVGGKDEEDFNRTLLASYPGFIDGGTENSLEEFAGLIMSCNWILTADTLGYHVACAVGTSAVCLVGPTSPWELDLYETNTVLHSDLDCIGCYRAKCPLPVTCMDLLTPKAIWSRLPKQIGVETGTFVVPSPC